MVVCEPECWQEVGKYFGECICTRNEEISFYFGVASIISWGFAEVPQIIQNCITGSSHGMSVLFVMIWLTGDFLNIVGCLLADAIKTQLYIAYVYTGATVVLFFQHLIFTYMYDDGLEDGFSSESESEEELIKDQAEPQYTQAREIRNSRRTSHEHHHHDSPRSSHHVGSGSHHGHHGPRSAPHAQWFTSSRTLATSPIPTSWMAQDWSRNSSDHRRHHRHHAHHDHGNTTPTSDRGGRSLDGHNMGPGADNNSLTAALLNETLHDTTGRASDVTDDRRRPSQRYSQRMMAMPIMGVLSLVSFMVSHQPVREDEAHQGFILQDDASTEVSGPHRHLLDAITGLDNKQLAEILGWIMAGIYFSSRVPQIFKNIARGSVEGLSAPMFMLAICGNATYMGSILFKSTDWTFIKPILPWIVDAIGCLVMDGFILCQWVYYTYYHKQPETPSSASDEYICAYEPIPRQRSDRDVNNAV